MSLPPAGPAPCTPDLPTRARAWAADDPDEVTAAALVTLVERAQGGDDAAGAELADAFAGPLSFGTAGLRGALGPGPNRMNRVVVIRAAAGLASYLQTKAGSPRHARPSVIIGYDARHGSSTFAADTAAVMTGAGVHALLLPRALPTPVLAFAVRHLRADAGVMVTASHNPRADNGYKVYLGGDDAGSQIVPPADAEIARAIAEVGDLASVPRATSGWEVLGEQVLADYLEAITGLVGPPPPDGRRSRLSLVLTPMHGVGGSVTRQALQRTGVTDVTLVPEQAEPDPDFPTLPYPNPEEPGAIDLALALARERGAALVIAVDPDADRCAVALPDPSTAAGAWRMLTGDELGAVLGEHIATGAAAAGADDAVLACSLVSSRLLGKIAGAHGLEHRETLTGFKWISRAPRLLFGYEEAIGYCVAPELVRDKDGVCAALVVAALAADLAAAGRSLLDVLDDLAASHGVHATGQVSFRVGDLSLIDGAMARLRTDPPAVLGGSAVLTVDDLALGSVTTTGVPPTDGLRWLTASGSRVVVRRSGTEPKLKCYLEVVGRPTSPEGVAASRERAHAELAALSREVRQVVGL